MPTRIPDKAAGKVDYRLNQLGLRVWRDTCQLICRSGERWIPLGPRFDLPLNVPRRTEELLLSWDSVRITAYQFLRECPSSDVAEVLAKRKCFDAALQERQLEVMC